MARCSSQFAVKIPDAVSVVSAAAVTVAFTVAYYSLVELTRLAPNESILIHSAAGAVGQAAISIAQKIGAEIYATVGNPSKKKLLTDNYAIPEDHIFSSRDLSFGQQVRRATNDRGVDVILNSTTGEALETSWHSLALFGRFVEIGKQTLTGNQRLDLGNLSQNKAYFSVELEVLKLEKPDLVSKMFEIVTTLLFSGKLQGIHPLTEFSMSEVEAAFSLVQSRESMGKVVVVPRSGDRVMATHQPQPISNIRSDASYLITGGGGGLGRSMAKWLVAQGARFIILISRRAADNLKVQELARELHTAGVQTCLQNCDVTDQGQVDQVIHIVSQTMPPIRGAIHGAMVLEDKLFENTTLSSYQTVLRPRVQGTFNVHKSLKNSPLDFFVMLSSTAGMIGNRGQASYAATTGFLDAFAAYRQHQNLPATTLDLGMIQGVGYVAERGEQLSSVLDEYVGVEGVREDEFLALLGAAVSGMIGSDSAWHLTNGLALKPHVPEPFWLSEPKFAYLRAVHSFERGLSGGKQDGGASQGTTANSVVERLKHARTLEEGKAIAYEALSTKLAEALGLPVEDLAPDRPTASYGLDSIVAITVRNWIKRTLMVQLPFFDLLAGSTLDALADHVVKNSKLVNSKIFSEEGED